MGGAVMMREKIAITICPACGPSKADVADTRPRNGIIHRRRVCRSCSHRWSTVEVPTENFKSLARALRQALAAQSAASDVAAILSALMPPLELSE